MTICGFSKESGQFSANNIVLLILPRSYVRKMVDGCNT